MTDSDFLKCLKAWTCEQDTAAPISCYDALSILYAILTRESDKAAHAIEESDQWVDAVENIYTLLTQSPLRYFVRDLAENDMDFINRIASLAAMEADLGHIPEYDDDLVLSHYLHTTPKKRLQLNLEHIN